MSNASSAFNGKLRYECSFVILHLQLEPSFLRTPLQLRDIELTSQYPVRAVPALLEIVCHES
jgi:hypothetical protein